MPGIGGPDIEPFVRAAVASKSGSDLLAVPAWGRDDWETLFSYALRTQVGAGEVLIRREAAERALYFVTTGLLEVTAILGSDSLGPIAKIHPGSVVGELSFLDGEPRSAKVWAVTDSELYRLDMGAYERFADAHPRRACDLLFAIGRVVALRMRRSQQRAAG
jgi:CRP/FNR family transcriptional regulator, cyclic AMP receptor protein